MRSSEDLPALIFFWNVKWKSQLTVANLSFIILEDDRCVQQPSNRFVEKIDSAIVWKYLVPHWLKVRIINNKRIICIAFFQFNFLNFHAGGVDIVKNVDGI